MDTETFFFPALDKSASTLTWLGVILLIALSIVPIIILWATSRGSLVTAAYFKVLMIAGCCFTLGILIYITLQIPQGVVINFDRSSLTIQKTQSWLSDTYDLKGANAAILTGAKFRRVNGSGGLGGYFGIFKADNVGEVVLYAKNLSSTASYVRINTPQKTLVIEVNSTEDFLSALKKAGVKLE